MGRFTGEPPPPALCWIGIINRGLGAPISRSARSVHGLTAPSWSSALRIMENPLGLTAVHWDHEPELHESLNDE